MTHHYTTFEDAMEAAGASTVVELQESEWMVCGTMLKDGEPAYFVMPRSIDEGEVHERAFVAREGRAPDSYERWVRRVAEERLQNAG